MFLAHGTVHGLGALFALALALAAMAVLFSLVFVAPALAMLLLTMPVGVQAHTVGLPAVANDQRR